MTDDWRLMGQEKYLFGKTLVFKPYTQNKLNPKWDHDHCSFCFAKFMVNDLPNMLHKGYCTEDEYYWICSNCYNDYKERFKWKLLG